MQDLPGKPPRLSYRPDVDGLRAVAVLLVIAGHLRTRLSGGFVGVDVFFVISGYLISAHILSEMADGTFSIVSFYERRVRRIFPALLVMLAALTALIGYAFVPSEVVDYGKSLLAALFSVSNFLFWTQNGYFDAPSEMKPLLHTWSLGVEEHFYIFFPLLLVLLRRFFPRRIREAIFAVAALSFVGACLVVARHEAAAFFFTPLRAWELLAGTIVSQRYLPQMRHAATRNGAAVLGLALIFLVPLKVNLPVPFPGPGALFSVVGAALLIASGEHGSTVVGKMLSWRPVVFVGLISYSLYLWHWPVMVLDRVHPISGAEASNTTPGKAVLLAISLALGTVSWALVETPFRKGRWRPGRRGVFIVNGVAMGVVTAAAVVMVLSKGLPGRFSPEAQKVAAYESYERGPMLREGVCLLGAEDTFRKFDQAACLGHAGGKRTMLIAGDSHSAHLYHGLVQAYPEDAVLQASVIFPCRPFVRAYNAQATKTCLDTFAFLYEQYLPRHPVDLLVLSARWDEGSLDGLGATIARVKSLGIPMVVVGPSVEFTSPEPRLLALAMRDGKDATREARANLAAGPRTLDAEMKVRAKTQWGVSYVSVYDDLCGQGECPVFAAPDVPLVFDKSHFTAHGSELMGRTLRARRELLR